LISRVDLQLAKTHWSAG